MSTELKAGDTITAESLNGIAEGAYTFKSGEILTASKLNTIAEAIEDKDEEIAELEGRVEELQAIIDAFPTIESLNVTQNGTYQEAGKAYTPVDVSVSSVTVEALNVTANGTYSESGKAYAPVTVNIPEGRGRLIPDTIIFNHNIHNRRSSAISFNEVIYPYTTPAVPGVGGIGVITISPTATSIAANTTAQYPTGAVTAVQGAQGPARYLAILHPASHVYSIESGTATIKETGIVNINGADFKISVVVTASTDPVTIAVD